MSDPGPEWVFRGLAEMMTPDLFRREGLALWDATLKQMKPTAAKKAGRWTHDIEDPLCQFPRTVAIAWIPRLAHIMGSLRDEHCPLLKRMWPWLRDAMNSMVTIFHNTGLHLRDPLEYELEHTEDLFMDLVKRGNFAPLVKKIANIRIRPGSFPTLKQVEDERLELSKQIMTSYATLCELMHQDEDFSTHSWNKKNGKQRDKIFRGLGRISVQNTIWH